MSWLDAVGWAGSALLVFSLLQTRVLRLRVLNTIACVVLIFFNAMIAVWPMFAMNIVLAGINLSFIVKLLRERHDPEAFEVLRVAVDDDYLRHLLRNHAEDIARHQPDVGRMSDPEVALAADLAFLVVLGDETVGVVLLRRDGEVAQVLLDYVTPRFRDFTPGEFVWRRSGMLNGLGFRRVATSPVMLHPYYDKVGFHADGPAYVLDL